MIIYPILSLTIEEHENDTEGSASDLNKKKDLSFITHTSIANNIGPYAFASFISQVFSYKLPHDLEDIML